MYNGEILALSAAVFSALYLIGLRIISQTGFRYLLIASYYHLISGLICLLTIFFIPSFVKTDPVSLLLLLIVCVGWMGYTILNLKVNNALEASIGIVLSQISTALIYFGNVFLFDQKMSNNKLAGVLIIIVANILIVFNKEIFHKKIDKSALILKLVAVLVFSALILFDVYNIYYAKITSPNVYAIITYLVPGVMFVIIAKTSVKEYFTTMKKIMKLVLWCAISGTVGYLLYLKSFDFIEPGLAGALSSTNVVLVSILGIYFLKEHEYQKQKLIAAAITIFGVILINLS